MNRTLRVGRIALVMIATAAAVELASPANADVDTDFANELHVYGIYGQRDYNAWIGKIVCKRMRTGLDANAFEAASFLNANLDKEADEQQVYQYLGTAIRFYCPDLQPALDALAGPASTAGDPT